MSDKRTVSSDIGTWVIGVSILVIAFSLGDLKRATERQAVALEQIAERLNKVPLPAEAPK